MKMILWGNIREFPLFTIVQFLAAQRRTGILEIQDFDEQICIYLTSGRIDAITDLQQDEEFGKKLVNAGMLTRAQVKDCWMLCGDEDQEDPILVSLLNLVVSKEHDSEALVKIIDDHLVEQILYLMYWKTGTFRLVVPSSPIHFPVTTSRSVEELLLEAYRRIDEGEQPTREKISLDEDPCITCTVECTPEIRQHYRKKDICLWSNMPSVMRDPLFNKSGARLDSIASVNSNSNDFIGLDVDEDQYYEEDGDSDDERFVYL